MDLAAMIRRLRADRVRRAEAKARRPATAPATSPPGNPPNHRSAGRRARDPDLTPGAAEVARVRAISTMQAGIALGVEHHAARLLATAADGADIAAELRRAAAIRALAADALAAVPNAAPRIADDLIAAGLSPEQAASAIEDLAGVIDATVAQHRAELDRRLEPEPGPPPRRF